MDYAEAVSHLYSLGPELATSQFQDAASAADGTPAPRRKFDLAHMLALCAALGNPQREVPSILIAGTNGKGSTAATLASILNAAGYRTGLYTSPHLTRINERVQVSRSGMLRPIGDADFAALYTLVDEACIRLVASGTLPLTPSFFERVTAVAFLHFARSRHPADVMVLEVGLGGRLDATNVVEPIFSIITDIALDHQEYLGDTITAIAREKCGILREAGALITLPQHPEANQAIGEMATALHVRGVNASPYLPPAIRNSDLASNGLPSNRYTLSLSERSLGEPEPLLVDFPLAGQHQQRNLALAIAAALELRNQHGYNISNAVLEQGIRDTVWPGRLERIALEPGLDLLLDVAHNPAGAWTLRAAIASLPSSQARTLIFSCLRDKDLAQISRILFPLFDASAGDPQRRRDRLILTPIASLRAAAVEDLAAAASALGIPAAIAHDSSDALDLARHTTPQGGLILATGSVYLVGELRHTALERAMAPA